MELTEIRITLGTPDELPLCGYCSVTFDHCFVVHDLRILRQNDRLFVAMPSRKRMVGCPFCRQKNAVQSRFCNNCGRGLKGSGATSDAVGRLYNDIAHPVNSDFREQLEQAILREYREVAAEPPASRAQEGQRQADSEAVSGKDLAAKPNPPAAPHFVRSSPFPTPPVGSTAPVPPNSQRPSEP